MSALSEIVQLTITADTIGIARAGFGVAMVLSPNVSWTERHRLYESLSDVAADFAVGSPEYLAADALFSQSPHPEQLIIGRAANKPTQKYVMSIASVNSLFKYYVNVVVSGQSPVTISYTTQPDIVGTLLPRTSNTLTSTAHGMSTGDGPYRLTTSASLPTGLAVDTNYWIIKIDANTFQFASSLANAMALTPVTLSGDGSGTQTIHRGNNDVIMAQLNQALNAVPSVNYASVQSGVSGSQLLTITGSAPANWFSLEVGDLSAFSISQTHADPGIAADLTAIQLENDSWYCLLTLYNSAACVAAAAAFIEAQAKIYLVDVIDTAAINTTVGNGDTLDALYTLSYNRTAGSFHSSPANMMSAAWAGRVLPDDPGSETWKFKILAGVKPMNLNATQRSNLRARKANTITTVAGENITWEGTIAGGSFGFIDITRGLDWLEDDMTKGVFGAFLNSEKIPFTDGGISIVRNEVKASLKRAARMGIIDDDFVIQVPAVGDISASDKALRKLPDVKFSATLQGAIHDVQIIGVVSV